jgi:hypothetical protein
MAMPIAFVTLLRSSCCCKGVPLERVSVLLGHTSMRVTERHYAPWVRARQEQLEADVRRTWDQDPVAFTQTKGTYKVHGGSARPN